jgi:hypothetical protein
MTPLTVKEIEDYFTDLGENKCPCCGNDVWGVHVDGREAVPVPALRAMPRIDVSPSVGNTIGGAIDNNIGRALVVAVFECSRCGFLHFLNYHAIIAKLRGVDDNA